VWGAGKISSFIFPNIEAYKVTSNKPGGGTERGGGPEKAPGPPGGGCANDSEK